MATKAALTTVKIPTEARRLLKIQAAEQGITMAELILKLAKQAAKAK